MLVQANWEFTEYADAILIKPKSPRLDFSNSLDLERFFDVFINEQAMRCVVLDLQNVAYVDSCALGVMVDAHRQICRKGRLCICNIHPQIMSVLKLTRLDEVFQIYADCDAVFSTAA